MERMKPTLYKIGEGERKSLSKDMQKIIVAYQEENKNLRDYADNLDSENDNQAIEIEELKKERDLYKARNEELNENCFGLSKENKKLKAELEKLKSTYVYDAKQVRDIC